MNEEEKNRVTVIAAAIVFVGVAVSSCTATNAFNVFTRANAAVEMQKNGADPLDIPCAIGDGTERYCELRAASKAAAAR